VQVSEAAEVDHGASEGAPQARAQGQKYEWRMMLNRGDFW
jgi:hypothetical protein